MSMYENFKPRDENRASVIRCSIFTNILRSQRAKPIKDSPEPDHINMKKKRREKAYNTEIGSITLLLSWTIQPNQWNQNHSKSPMKMKNKNWPLSVWGGEEVKLLRAQRREAEREAAEAVEPRRLTGRSSSHATSSPAKEKQKQKERTFIMGWPWKY